MPPSTLGLRDAPGETAAVQPTDTVPEAKRDQKAAESVLPSDAQLAAHPPPAGPDAELLPGPESLVGLTGPALLALLGDPDFRRRDPPAELWQYKVPDCILDVFLYDETGKDQPRVIHLEARGRTVARVPARACYFSLLQARQPANEGGG